MVIHVGGKNLKYPVQPEGGQNFHSDNLDNSMELWRILVSNPTLIVWYYIINYIFTVKGKITARASEVLQQLE